MAEQRVSQTCPKCGHPRGPEVTECAHCGVVFQRYRPAQVPARPAPAVPSSRVPPDRLESVLEGIAQALSAGVTLRAAASAGALDPLPAPIAQAVRADIEAGVPFSETLERLGLLDPGTRAAIRAAEARGELPGALRLASAETARRRKLRFRLLLGLAYPLFLLVAAVVVLPLPVAFGKGGVAAYLVRVAPRLACMGAALVLALVVIPRLRPSSPVRRAIRWIGVRSPIAAQAALNDALSTFAGLLGACIKAGLPVRESLTLAAHAAGPHPAFAGAAERLVEAIDRGASLVDALRRIPAFPAADLAQVGTAELAGTLDSALPALEARHRDRARILWWTLAAAVGIAVFLGIVALVTAQILSGWQEILRAQSQQIDELMR
jgi:type II secretory pathway component PulF